MTLLMRPEPLSQEFTRLFEGLLGEANGGRRWVPAMDLVEQEDAFVLRADLPGLSEDDVSIEFENGLLTISGERRFESDRGGRGWHRMERGFGRFGRTLTLPDGVDAGAITASFDRGVLEVRVPKPDERKPRRIAIGANGHRTLEGSATETPTT